MNNETQKPLINQIDALENRIDTIEDQMRKKGYGLMDFVRDGAILVALLTGILGAAGTIKEHLDKQGAKPNIQSKLGDNLKLYLDQYGQLNLAYRLTLNNIGDDKDIVTVKRAYVIFYALGTEELFNLEDISVSEDGDSISSISVKADARHTVDIISGSKLTPDKRWTFLETRPRKLVLELNYKKSGQNPEIPYCILLTEPSVKDLREKDETKFIRPFEEKACKSGYQ